MKYVIFMVIFSLCQLVFAEDQVPFANKIYTPEVVVDQNNDGPKGAVQLLWQRNPSATRYEVEVSNGKLVYSQVGDKHFHHIMLYFGKDYQWRVREVSAVRTTEFSPWRSLRVMRTQKLADNRKSREPVSVESPSDIEEYMLDTGAE